MFSVFTRISVVTVAAAFLTVVLFAQGVVSSTSLAAPEGRIMLRVSGDISARNVGNEAHFDLALMEQLGTETVVTTTIWTEGEQEFRGTPLAAIVRAIGAETGTLRALAINDYSIEIPVQEALNNGAIVAFERNGSMMSVRDKGPLWIVYPYDSHTKYQAEVFYSRSVWQLDRLVVSR